jgi:hypothetical protein
MPKEQRAPSTHRQSPFPTTQARQSKPVDAQPGQRNTVNWSSADDEVLVAARAAGLNWQSTAEKHFPNKTANACRKRHERLVERQTQDDWSTQRLSTLAIEYMEFRKEIWTIIAARTGERWSVVEAKVSYLNAAICVGIDNSGSVWRRVSRIYNLLHAPLPGHLLHVRIFLPQVTRKKTRVTLASAIRTLNWSQSMRSPGLYKRPQVQWHLRSL